MSHPPIPPDSEHFELVNGRWTFGAGDYASSEPGAGFFCCMDLVPDWQRPLIAAIAHIGWLNEATQCWEKDGIPKKNLKRYMAAKQNAEEWRTWAMEVKA